MGVFWASITDADLCKLAGNTISIPVIGSIFAIVLAAIDFSACSGEASEASEAYSSAGDVDAYYRIGDSKLNFQAGQRNIALHSIT